MTKLSKTGWNAKYDAVNGVYGDNVTKQISPADLRDGFNDMPDSFQFLPEIGNTFNPAMDLSTNQIFSPYTQSGAVVLSVSAGIEGMVQVVKWTSDGSSITVPASFDEISGSFQYMVDNPGTYKVLFMYYDDGTTQEVWCSLPGTEVVADTTAPVYQSSEVGSVDATSLILTYDEALDTGSVPATTDFVVNDGAANAVTNVSISGVTVDLTLTNPVDSGDTVVVSYTSGGNPLQDAAGNACANLTTESVTNNVADVTAPVFQSAEIGSVDDTSLIMTYNENLDGGSIPATTDFVVNVNASPVAVTNVAISTSTVDLTLTSAVSGGDTVTVSYTSGGNPLQDSAANACANLTSESVTNNVSSDYWFRLSTGSNEAQSVGDDLVRISGNANFLAGGSTIEALADGADGHFLWQIITTNNQLCGLSTYAGTTPAGLSDVDFAMYLIGGGTVRVFESGTNRGDKDTFLDGDWFRVRFAAAENSGRAIYEKSTDYNPGTETGTWTLVYNSAVARPSGQMSGCGRINLASGEINNAKMFGTVEATT